MQRSTFKTATKRPTSPKSFLLKRLKSTWKAADDLTQTKVPTKRLSTIAKARLSTHVGLFWTRQSVRSKWMIPFKIHRSCSDIALSLPYSPTHSQSLRQERRKTSQRFKCFRTNFFKTSFKRPIIKSGPYCAQIAAQSNSTRNPKKGNEKQ